MSKVLWLYNRLKAMPPEEIAYRVKKTTTHKFNAIRFNKPTKVYEVKNINIDLDKLYSNLSNIFNKKDIYSIELNDTYSVFGEKVDLNNALDWHKGTSCNWDENISSYDFEFKNTDDIGDIRYTWEVNRHQFLLYLAAAYTKTQDMRYLDVLENNIEQWIVKNKFLKGVNWSSPMEIALRAYQWTILLFLIEKTELKKLKEKLAKSIIVSIEYVMKNLSLYSSANNHLILEVAISSLIGVCFDGVYQQKWFQKGYEILNKEVRNQFHDDGVNKEQALHYQAFVTDIMLQYNSIMKKIGYNPIEEALIEKSIEFIYLLNSDKQYVDFGDSDDAKIITFNSNKYNYYDYILCFASIYYKKEFSDKHSKYPEIELFLDINVQLEEVDKTNFVIFEHGGYSIINYVNDMVIFDFGELGFGNLAAHGHADALMVNYYKDGNPIFIDSGTYIYNIERDKRDYYRSTEAHNTLCYDNKNQSEIKGPFLWGKKSKSSLKSSLENDDIIMIEAQNDGYSPSIHNRKIVYHKANKDFVIYDYFDKPADINFILDENVNIEIINNNIIRLINKKDIYMYCDGKISIYDITISKKFMEEINSKRINIRYEFFKEHLVYISDDIDTINRIVSERKSTIEES